MITSVRIPHDSNLYHERIYEGDDCIAYILSDYDTFCYVDNKEQFVYKGYKTVADAKDAFFATYKEPANV
jgi:hypothetical protein